MALLCSPTFYLYVNGKTLHLKGQSLRLGLSCYISGSRQHSCSKSSGRQSKRPDLIRSQIYSFLLKNWCFRIVVLEKTFLTVSWKSNFFLQSHQGSPWNRISNEVLREFHDAGPCSYTSSWYQGSNWVQKNLKSLQFKDGWCENCKERRSGMGVLSGEK